MAKDSPSDEYRYESAEPVDREVCEQRLASVRARDGVWAAFAEQSQTPIDQLRAVLCIGAGVAPDGRAFTVVRASGDVGPSVVAAFLEILRDVQQTVERAAAGEAPPVDRRPS